MEHRFAFISEETSRLHAALELALFSKIGPSTKMYFEGWSVEGSTLTLHTNPSPAQHPFPCGLSVEEVLPMVRSWYGANQPQKVKHEFDVSYHKAVAIIVLVFRFGEAFGRMSMEVLW